MNVMNLKATGAVLKVQVYRKKAIEKEARMGASDKREGLKGTEASGGV
jgi:hypothetical protein